MSFLMTPEDVRKVCAEAVKEALREAARDITAGSDWALERGDGEGGYVGGFDAAIAFVLSIVDPDHDPQA
jgi:hypothetical protein